MIEILTALIPVFALILVGHALYRANFLGEPGWSALEHIVYYLLFPALIIRTVALADFSRISVAGLIGGFLLALLVVSGVLVASKPFIARVFSLSDASFSSLFQGITRWHGFMALAIVTAIFGPASVPIVAVALAALVPALNVVNVMVLIRWGDRGNDAARLPMLRQLIRNPFIIAGGIGALLNVSSVGLPGLIEPAFKLLADGALGISLLTIGAGLRPITATGDRGALAFGVAFRFLVMPALFFGCLTLFGVNGEARTVATLCGAVPTAASAYVLARRMGGDAPLMAGLITIQVLVAMVTLPITIWVLKLVG